MTVRSGYAPPIIRHFGDGMLVVETGKYGGKPAVFVARAKFPGKPGESAARENNPSNSLLATEWVLTFPTDEQARNVADALVNTAAPRGPGGAHDAS